MPPSRPRRILAVTATLGAITASVAAAPAASAAHVLAVRVVATARVSPDARAAMSAEPPAPPAVVEPATSESAQSLTAPTPAPAPDPRSAPASPAPVRLPLPAVRVVVPAVPVVPVVQVVPAAPPIRNMLISADGSLDTAVGVYTDCSGDTPLTQATAAIDTCIAGPTYFVGHNYGVFTPLMSMSVGDVITWYDSHGTAHRLRIVSIRDGWELANGAPKPTESDVVAQFQTCETYSPSGVYDRIVDAVRD